MLDDARRHDAGRFAGHARRRRRVHHADGGLSDYQSQRAARSCSMWVRPDDGMIIIRAELDAMAGARPRAVLVAEAERLWRADHPDHQGPVPAEARTNPQRLADAFCTIFGRLPTPGLAPETAEVLVSVTLDQLRGDHREPAEVCGVGPIPAATARRIACEAAIIPVVLGGHGGDPRFGPQPPARHPGPAAGAAPPLQRLRHPPLRRALGVVPGAPHLALDPRRADRPRGDGAAVLDPPPPHPRRRLDPRPNPATAPLASPHREQPGPPPRRPTQRHRPRRTAAHQATRTVQPHPNHRRMAPTPGGRRDRVDTPAGFELRRHTVPDQRR